MRVYVEVAVHVPGVTDVFDYHLPEDLQEDVTAGQLVEVPFGPQQVQGILIRRVDTPKVPETKPVAAILDRRISLTPHQIALAFELQKQTLAPLSACISLMLPTGISQMADTLYILKKIPQNTTSLNEKSAARCAAARSTGPCRAANGSTAPGQW